MEKLAEELGLEFDGGDDDRLRYSAWIYWGAKSEEEYTEIETKIREYEVVKDKWEVVMAYDISGYDYWMNQQHETNYTYPYAFIKDVNLTEDEKIELYNDIEEAFYSFVEYDNFQFED